MRGANVNIGSLLHCLLLFLFLPRKLTAADRSCRRLPRIKQGMVRRSVATHTLIKGSRKRVSKGTFNCIVGRIQHDLQRDTVTEDSIAPAFRMAVCLYCLAG